MRLAEWQELKLQLKCGMKISVLYRSNWRGGEGRPFNHRRGKSVEGTFLYIDHEGVLLRNHDYPINYKAIKMLTILKR